MRRSEEAGDGVDVLVTAADFSEKAGQLAVCTASGDYILYETGHNQFVHAVSCTPYPLTSVKILSDSQVCVASVYE